MTDLELATALLTTIGFEKQLRASLNASVEQRDDTRAVLRHTVAQRKSLEQWISARVVRAQRV